MLFLTKVKVDSFLSSFKQSKNIHCSSRNCGLGIQGGGAPDYPSVSFNLWRATWATYRDFIGELRERVTRGTELINGVPVLRPANSVPVRERFVLVRLINHDGNIVTLAVDVVNLYVVAFSANRRSYFFRNSTELQRNNLFVDTTQTSLPFTVNYGQIENAPGILRESIPLGPTPLADATTRLWYGRSVAEPLLVVAQRSQKQQGSDALRNLSAEA
ncbi:unnamed protein product [Ilex paraguariensis]|uniref:rRNA N-glycosylase n=1 Tax=Ilex paraguariensis TaxID=185542 RepID=A0ABC8RAW7_9AQUA